MELQDYTDKGLAELEVAIATERLRRHECRLVHVITQGTPKLVSRFWIDGFEEPPEGVSIVQRPANHPDNVVLRSLYSGHVIGFADKAHPDLVMADDGRNVPTPTFRAYTTELMDGKRVPARYVGIDGYGKPFNEMMDTHVHCTDDKWWPVGECDSDIVYDDEDGDDVIYTHNPALAAS